MKVEFIKPFVNAAYKVLQQEVKVEEIEKGELNIVESTSTSREVTVMIGVTGDVQGIVLYGLTERTAKLMVSALTGERVPVFNRLVESAIAEMGNMITGQASADLEQAGYICRITPPTVVVGRGAIISTVSIPKLVIPLITPLGDLEICVALRENR